jgi:hypothetical protein
MVKEYSLNPLLQIRNNHKNPVDTMYPQKSAHKSKKEKTPLSRGVSRLGAKDLNLYKLIQSQLSCH